MGDSGLGDRQQPSLKVMAIPVAGVTLAAASAALSGLVWSLVAHSLLDGPTATLVATIATLATTVILCWFLQPATTRLVARHLGDTAGAPQVEPDEVGRRSHG